MLRLRYFEKFRGGHPFIVIIGDRDGMQRAHDFFSRQGSSSLHDSQVMDFYDLNGLIPERLSLSDQEASDIAELFLGLARSTTAAHIYFDTTALGDDIEILISYGEYDNLF